MRVGGQAAAKPTLQNTMTAPERRSRSCSPTGRRNVRLTTFPQLRALLRRIPADRVRHGEAMDARRRSGPGTESHVTPPSNRPSRHLPSPSVHAPNAALLIDFDNVTLGIR